MPLPPALRCFAGNALSNSTTALPLASCPVTIRRVDFNSIVESSRFGRSLPLASLSHGALDNYAGICDAENQGRGQLKRAGYGRVAKGQVSVEASRSTCQSVAFTAADYRGLNLALLDSRA